MERTLPAMSTSPFDLLLIGGGITGAAVAWDAALRGLRVALVEKNDFGHGTSAATSKLIHGGLRYLKQGELGLVRESLRERRYMQTITPHLVYPLPFLVPAYGWGTRGPLPLLAGALLYNALSHDRNRVPHEDQQIPAARLLGRRATLRREPALADLDPTGGMLYYDGQLYDPGRHVLEFVLSAAEHDAQVANYAEVTNLVVEGSAVQGANVYDHLNDATYQIRARVTANVTGPWADYVLGLLDDAPPDTVRRSKGIHIITRPLGTMNQALGLQTPDGRHLFILPWRGRALIGTTDVPFEGSPDDPLVTEKDVLDFIATINATYPPANLELSDVEHFYGGLRPIVDMQTEDTYHASRKYEIYDHAEDGVHGLFTVIGGKYTTSRGLAETLIDRVLEQIDRPAASCTTRHTPLHGAPPDAFSTFLPRMQHRYDDLPAPTVEHLARSYGTRIDALMTRAAAQPALRERLSDQSPDITAQVDHAVEYEMARRLADVVHRRTGLGSLGPPEPDTLETIAQRMAHRLDWTAARIDEELEHTMATFELASPSETASSSSEAASSV